MIESPCFNCSLIIVSPWLSSVSIMMLCYSFSLAIYVFFSYLLSSSICDCFSHVITLMNSFMCCLDVFSSSISLVSYSLTKLYYCLCRVSVFYFLLHIVWRYLLSSNNPAIYIIWALMVFSMPSMRVYSLRIYSSLSHVEFNVELNAIRFRVTSNNVDMVDGEWKS
jgi:hypothetical protein